jgi:multimeric flavodoxin WrbA
MRVTVLDGTRDGREEEALARRAVATALDDRASAITTFPLRELKIHHCLGCFGCWIKTPGVCVIDDTAREVAAAVVQSDLVIYLTPITFGGYSSELKKALDRNICLISPDFTTVQGETHHKKRYDRYPSILAVGLLDRSDAESEHLFATLVERNAINMHSPAQASTVVYSDAGLATIADQIRRELDDLEVAE